MEYFNPLDKFYKSQTGAVCENEEITFRVKGDFNSVVFVLRKDGESDCSYYKLIKKEDYFECVIVFARGLYFYFFEINGKEKFISLSNRYTGELTSKVECFQLTVYDKNFNVPDWVNGGIIYQIFPDRFNIGNLDKKIPDGRILHTDLNDVPIFMPNENGEVLNNDFFGGDFLGVIQKLDYLVDLGVSIIYFNPIFKAYSNHRYDTGDYMQIDPMLGTIEDFKELIKQAKAKGIKIVLDGVFNHTGADSIYFNKYNNYDSLGAFQSPESKYYSWYNFTKFPSEYETWWGIKTLPCVNENNLEYIDFITGKDGVLEHYTKLGIAGWRLDVVDELPGFFVRKIREAVKTCNKDAIIIGEVWEDASNKIAYGKRREYFQGFELDSVMNYPLKNAIIEYAKSENCLNLAYIIKEQIDHYPTNVLNSLMNILATHDTYRLISALSDADVKTKAEMVSAVISSEEHEKIVNRLKVATLLQFTLPGIPTIYYGDEIGMEGFSDPLNRKFFSWEKQNLEILNWYKFLGKLRNNYLVFKDGEFIPIYCHNGTFIYKRSNLISEILIAINLEKKDYYLSFDGELINLINNKKAKNEFVLKPNSFAILVNKI